MSTTPAPLNNNAPDPNAPPAVNAPAPSMDLSALNQPGASLVNGQAAPSRSTALQNSYEQAVTNQQAAADKAAQIANTPTVVPPQPHQRLLQMVTSLAEGLSAVGTSLSTHGREGGAPMVEAMEAQRQQQAIQAQQANQAQKNQQIQQQLTVGDTNRQLAQSYLNLASMPDEMNASHLKVQSTQQGVIGQAQDIRTKALQDFTMTGDLNAYNKTLSQLDATSGGASTTGAQSGTTPTTGAPAVTIPPVAIASWKNSVDAASSAYPNDPMIKQYAATLADSNATSLQLAAAANGAKNRMGTLDAATESRTKQYAADTNAPFGTKAGALNAAMLQRFQVLNPSATALPAGLTMSADSTPKDFDRADKILQQTETAQATKANRDIVNGMRQQTLALSGLGAPGGDTRLTGDAYLQTLSAPEQALVKEIGIGKASPTRMDYLLSRNPKLTAEVALAYPDFDSSKAASYPATYKDFTSGKTSVALNAGGTALGHLYELQELNTPASHIPHTPAWTAYQNKAATVSTELAKFYGDATVPAIENIQNTLTSTLPGNRDAAIQTQAQSMGDKLDAYEQEWKNAAPSKIYQADMPGISPQAKAARAKLDPNYAAAQTGALPSATPALPPAAPGTVNIRDSKGGYHNIPQASLPAARQRDPNLTVLQ